MMGYRHMVCMGGDESVMVIHHIKNVLLLEKKKKSIFFMECMAFHFKVI